MKFLFFFPWLFASLALAQDDWAGKRYEENGVTVIENYGRALYPDDAFRLEPQLTIGDESTTYEGEPLGTLAGVAVDERGQLYLADKSNSRVLVLTPDGRFVRSFGQKGKGPGEFVAISGIELDEAGLLYVLDRGQRRIHIWHPEGRFLRSFPVPGLATAFDVKNAGNIYVAPYSFLSKKYLIVQFDSTGRRVREFREKSPETDRVSQAGASARIRVWGDRLFYSLSYPYRIERYSLTGGLEQVILLRRSGFRAPTSAKVVSGPKGKHVIGGTLPAQTRNFCIDSDGRLFVQVTFDRGRNELDIFSPDGKYLQTLTLPEEQVLAEVKGDRLYTFVRGTMEGFPSVTRWRVSIKVPTD